MDRGGPPTRPRAGLTARLFGLASRLVIWYAIVTVIFRCPSSPVGLADSSPQICAPYLAVRSRVTPYISPYYETYAAPYVDVARPYAESFYGNVYLPTSELVVSGYSRYAAPQVAKTRAYAESEWRRVIVPRIEDLTGKAEEQYEVILGPYVKRVNTAVAPHLENARNIAVDQYRGIIVPSYQKSVPYVQTAYEHGRQFTVEVGVPYTFWAYKGLVTFVRRRVWPPVRIVYGKNVEPQLSKIRERLSSYRDSKKLEAAVEADAESELEADEPEVEQANPESTLEESGTASTAVFSSTVDPSTASSASSEPEPSADAEDGKLTDELKRWQAKFSLASDKGAEDLANRVSDITARQIENQVNGLGSALVTQLEEASRQELGKLKSAILEAVQGLPEDATENDQNAAYNSVLSSLRSSGSNIKDKAQELRIWKAKYRQETQSLVQSALDSTVEVIDNIRDLGLQQIGLRWAAMDSVTYQDWQEYHALKKSFDDWRVQVKSIALEHEGLAKAWQAGEDAEDTGMQIAQDVAAELSRLKDVARWKLHAHDASEDFSSRQLPAAAARLGQAIQDKVTKAKSYVESLTTTKGTVESVVSMASEAAAGAASSASSVVVEPIREAGSAAEDEDEDDDGPIHLGSGNEEAPPRGNANQNIADNVLDAVRDMVSKRKAATDAHATEAAGTEFSSQGLAGSIVSAASEKIRAMSEETFEPDVDVAQDIDDEEFLSTVSEKVESIVSQASRPAGLKASAILSEMVSKSLKAQATEASDPIIIEPEEPQDGADYEYPVDAEDAEIVMESASDDIAERVSDASEAASSAAEEYEASAESIYGRASSTAADTASIIEQAASAASEASATVAHAAAGASDDIVDEAHSISESVQSAASEAGEQYSTFTEIVEDESPEYTDEDSDEL